MSVCSRSALIIHGRHAIQTTRLAAAHKTRHNLQIMTCLQAAANPGIRGEAWDAARATIRDQYAEGGKWQLDQSALPLSG